MVKIKGTGDDGKQYTVEITEDPQVPPQPVDTTVTLVIKPNSPVVVGTAVTIEAHVAPATAAGSVDLFIDMYGETVASAPVVNGKAVFSGLPELAPSAPGTRQFQVVFLSADPSRFRSSVSAQVTHTAVEAPVPNPTPTPTKVTVGTATHVIDGVNTQRGDGQLIVYRAPLVRTSTSKWGTEVAVSAPVLGKVVGKFDRAALNSTTPTEIPAGGFVLSGHNSTTGGAQSADWLNANVKIGDTVTLSPAAPPVDPPPVPTGKLYLFGASGEGTDDGSLNAWLTAKALRMVGVWSDREGTEIGDLGPGDAYASWRGPVDIALGGLRAGQTWAEAAKGTYDAEWRERIANLKAAWGSRPEEWLWARIAHEFNGDFSEYFASQAEAPAFVAAFRRWAQILLDAMPKAHPVWSPNDWSNVSDVAAFWPGAAYAHAVAVDKYNAWPHLNTLAEFQAHANDREPSGNPFGVETWRLFAEERKVPMYFGEVGNPGAASAPGGGGDAPDWFTFIENFCVTNAANADVMTNPAGSAGKVMAAIWFNISDGYPAKFRFFVDSTAAADPLQPQFAARLRQAKVVGMLPAPGVVQQVAARVSVASESIDASRSTAVVPVMGEYMMDGVGTVSQLSDRCNRLLVAFYQGTELVEWGGDSPSKTATEINAWSARRPQNQVLVSIGGQGGLVQVDKIAAGMKAIHEKQFAIDGIDFDNEAFQLTTVEVLKICRDTAAALDIPHSMLAVQFVPPGGPPVAKALDAAVAVQQDGFPVAFGQQLYETSISDSDVMDATARAVSRLGQSSVLVGMMLGDWFGSWTAVNAVSRIKAVRQVWPQIGGAYIWESARPGTRAVVDAVGAVLGT